MMNSSSVDWYEIPVTDMARGMRFYEAVFATKLNRQHSGPVDMAVFPYDRNSGGVSGCLVNGPSYTPARTGTVVYLNASPSIDVVLERVRDAGGEILFPKTALPPGLGFFAHIADTEGNCVGVHALE
jgi:uncharacterized protein